MIEAYAKQRWQNKIRIIFWILLVTGMIVISIFRFISHDFQLFH